ncbi:MAG: superoxide dismutase [Alphaproteobacteria bacterium]|nr:superoxide dismutase [Alphaproteobacteria bacterium]MBL6938732.1 superoxide dismutase [Alphaproteobacteria bacterium]MBL7097911.1 superoxide dismutase [Alphaproteobacteria bacterium]
MSGPFELAPLPWDESVLEPAISARTIGFHYHKHHRTYVDTLNTLVKDTAYADMPLERVVQATVNAKDGSDEKNIFNNAAQVWNHDFYWRSLTPRSGKPPQKLAQAIERDFGSPDKLLEKLAASGKEQFGSGWVWLTSQGGKLGVEKTANAIDPMAKRINCLLTLDVWEHAYYLDYQNERPKYLEAALRKLVNWTFAAENFEREAHAVRAAAE